MYRAIIGVTGMHTKEYSIFDYAETSGPSGVETKGDVVLAKDIWS